MFFRVPKKHRKMYPKSDENGAKSDSRRVPKIDPEKSNKAPHVRDRVWVPSGAPFWMVFGTFFGTFFDDFWVHFFYIFRWFASSLFKALRHTFGSLWEVMLTIF